MSTDNNARGGGASESPAAGADAGFRAALADLFRGAELDEVGLLGELPGATTGLEREVGHTTTTPQAAIAFYGRLLSRE